MTLVTAEVVRAVRIPVGVQVLSHAASAALAVAHASGAGFIRVEGFVFASVSDEGLVNDACASRLLRDRTRLGAQGIRIYADLRKKHSSHAITADLTMTDWVEAAHFFGADGVIVTGTATGIATPISDLSAARKSCGIPVIAGSGATASSVREALSVADAVIVGSDLKQGGVWSNELDHARVDGFVRAAKG
jgi:membrane complex biogenesis BtpA family protein